MTRNMRFDGGLRAKLLIVDDHPLIREGLTARITSQPDLEVCGEATSVDEALGLMTRTIPDLVIVDMALAESHGLDLIKEIHDRFPDTKMLVVSAYDESLYAERALRAGAHGYINKCELQDGILKAIRTVLDGECYVSPELTQRLVNQAVGVRDSSNADPVAGLSDREMQVFQLIGRGQTSGAIARQLHLSPHTIDTYREKLRHKLGVKNGVELMQRAVQWILESG